MGCTNSEAACTSDEQPEHTATVSSFALDTFEVTVGRFRKFVEAYDGTPPQEGEGAHPMILGSGWQSSWVIAQSKQLLVQFLNCDNQNQTWTDTASSNENAAINCVDWWTAFAFCIWDGGRLPTEAEWEYAAAGGDENRLYPWGSEDPFENPNLANDWYSAKSPFVPVGTYPEGAARWGHLDMAGGMYEWTFDVFDGAWYGGTGNSCNDCANTSESANRVARGGSWRDDSYVASVLRSAGRYQGLSYLDYVIGFRCARSAP